MAIDWREVPSHPKTRESRADFGPFGQLIVIGSDGEGYDSCAFGRWQNDLPVDFESAKRRAESMAKKLLTEAAAALGLKMVDPSDDSKGGAE